jgi:hypothetical protein
MSPPYHPFRHWHTPRHISDEGRHQAAQVEASVEPVGEGSQVELAVYSVLQRVERAGRNPNLYDDDIGSLAVAVGDPVRLASVEAAIG